MRRKCAACDRAAVVYYLTTEGTAAQGVSMPVVLTLSTYTELYY
jgi:hypothetical protein